MHGNLIKSQAEWFNEPPPSIDLATEFPEVARSVFNYGVRDLCGLLADTLSFPDLEHHLAEVIETFEPRILRNTLRVTVRSSDSEAGNPSMISIEVHGKLWAQPMPEELFVRTELDLESGQCVFQD